MIELVNVTKKFGKFEAVKDISFSVKKGEITGFLGPNAAGKTTTMRMITGFFPPTEGKVSVGGFDTALQPVNAKEKTGYMPENVPLYKELSVMSYLEFIAGIKGVKKSERIAKINKAMEETGITGVRNKIIGNLI